MEEEKRSWDKQHRRHVRKISKQKKETAQPIKDNIKIATQNLQGGAPAKILEWPRTNPVIGHHREPLEEKNTLV